MISDEFCTFITYIEAEKFSISNMLTFNRYMAMLPNKEDNEKDSEFFKTLATIEVDIMKIRKNSFGWNQTRADNLQQFFLKFANLKGPIYLELCNNEYLTKKIPIEYFKLYAAVNYGRVGGTPVYDSIIRTATHMLTFFNNSIFLKDFVFMTKLPTKSCFLFDPIFRQRVREINRANTDLKRKYFCANFDLKEFVFLCIDRYFPNVGWRWTGHGHLAHLETLSLVVNMFEYGLWESKDINRLLTNIYAISEIMFNLENYLHNDRDNIHQVAYFTQQITGCARVRELIASAFLHIILIYLDEDLDDKLPAFNIPNNFNDGASYKVILHDPKKVKMLFKYSNFNKNKLYTYFSYILVTYLGRYKHIKNSFDPVQSEDLSFLLSILFTYISDINGDFYKISIKMIKSNYMPFYFLQLQNVYASEAIEFKNKLELLITDIKNQTYGQLNSDYSSFLTRLKDIFKEIELYLRTNEDPSLQYRVIITKKIVLSLYNIPHYILSLLHLITDFDNEPDSTKIVFREGLNLIRKIGIENYPGFNQMFTGYNFYHMKSLYSAKINEMNAISKELVIRSETLPLIEYNPDIIHMLLNLYEDLIKSFLDMYNKIGPEKNFSEMNFKIILSLYKLNDILSTLLESFANKRSKYELYIAKIIKTLIPHIFKLFVEEEIIPENKRFYDFWKLIQKQSNSFVEQIHNWDILENSIKRMFVLELFRTFLVTFNRATSRLYTKEILDEVLKLFNENCTLTKYFKYFDCEIGISILNQLVRLYNNFMIFRQNHLINKRFEEFGNVETQTTEITLPDYLLEKEISEELLGLKLGSLLYLENFGMNNDLFKFYFCSFLPLLFKYYSGLLTTFIYEDHKTLKRDFERALDLIEEFNELITIIDTKLKASVDLKNGEVKIPHKYKKVDAVDVYLSTFINLFKENNSEFFYDESTRNNIYHKRQKGYLFCKNVLEIYAYDNKKKIHLERYIRFDPFNAHRKIAKIMRKKLRFNYLYRKSNNLYKDEALETIFNISTSDPIAIIKIIDERYETTKTQFFEFPENNKCFEVLKTTDILKNNIEYFITYFFSEMSKMDLKFENLRNNILTNSSFISLILMMDNLIKISDAYRETFYKFLSTKREDTLDTIRREVIKKIWKFHKMLYYLTLYKTFFDRDWAEIYTLYYLVSNFLQNLCEDNFIQFKIWFHENDMIKDNGKSLFLYYFSMFEAAFHNSKIHKNKSPTLMLSDKPELFSILSRLTVGMTEFINGGAVRTQFEIYKYKIDVWVGIILRVIDDVDSKFYELKENILTFILGLTEGYDDEVINFMATNFPITRLYNLIYHLTKKLFVRQKMLKRGIKKEKEPSYLNYYCYKISEDDEKVFPIMRTENLLDFYKKYDVSFSDHIILSIVIKTYTLMRDLSVKVVRYENFLIEKREDIKIYIKNEKFTTENLEPLYVWHFLKKIIIDIEISYKDANLQDEESSIRTFYFKKLPQCFFLTEVAKSEFRSRVNIENLDEKHKQFFNEIEQYDIITKDLQTLYCKSKTLFNLSTEGSFYYFMVFLYVIALAINIILLVFYDEVNDDFNNERGNLETTRLVLSIIIAVLSFLLSIFWFTVKYNTVRKINWEKYHLTHPKKNKPKLWHRIVIDFYSSIVKVGVIQTFILHFIFSLLGLLVNPFFYTILLLLIIHLSLIVYSVVLSFMNNYDKLFFTLLIIVVVINSFSYLATQYYRDNFSDQDIGAQNGYVCHSYFSCLMNSVNIGLRGGGGISDFLKFQSAGKASLFVGRLFFDVIFFIMVNLILLGIFFGIIVDSFKELRDELSKRKKDENEICFTCGLQRVQLERKGIDFDDHLKIHDIWNYFFYILYLRWKPENDYDGVDIYVHNMILQDYNTGWLPIGKTLAYEKANKK